MLDQRVQTIIILLQKVSALSTLDTMHLDIRHGFMKDVYGASICADHI